MPSCAEQTTVEGNSCSFIVMEDYFEREFADELSMIQEEGDLANKNNKISFVGK